MIRLKNLLVEIGGSLTNKLYPSYWVQKQVPKIAASLGEEFDRVLGGGANGIASLLKSGKVLKITTDMNEVAAASRYRTKQNVPHLVSIYDVRPLTGNIIAANDTEATADDRYNIDRPSHSSFEKPSWYVIIMDYIIPFNTQEKDVWWVICNAYLKPDADINKLKQKLTDTAAEYNLPEITVNKFLQQRDSVLSAFKRNDVHADEAHTENMGWNSQGQLVHFDWWMIDQKSEYWNRKQNVPRRLNKAVKYDASGIDTPNDPTM